MAVSALSAARTLCELRDWNISNLALQKILYIAEMYHLGMTGKPLIREDFEAWDYGPVVPEVYSQARGFGSGPVPNVFHWIPSVPPHTEEHKILAEVADMTKRFSAGQLVDITHWTGGAWARNYHPGERGIVIPKSEIAEEYRARSSS